MVLESTSDMSTIHSQPHPILDNLTIHHWIAVQLQAQPLSMSRGTRCNMQGCLVKYPLWDMVAREEWQQELVKNTYGSLWSKAQQASGIRIKQLCDVHLDELRRVEWNDHLILEGLKCLA